MPMNWIPRQTSKTQNTPLPRTQGRGWRVHSYSRATWPQHLAGIGGAGVTKDYYNCKAGLGYHVWPWASVCACEAVERHLPNRVSSQHSPAGSWFTIWKHLFCSEQIRKRVIDRQQVEKYAALVNIGLIRKRYVPWRLHRNDPQILFRASMPKTLAHPLNSNSVDLNCPGKGFPCDSDNTSDSELPMWSHGWLLNWPIKH